MKKKILIVDDERAIREALSKVLRAENYDVIATANGSEALEKFKSEKIDLALLDLGLPVKDAWRIMEWLAQVNPFLPVIIIIGRSNQRELAERMGADAIMEKPLNVPRLLQVIRVLINEPMECRTRCAAMFRYIPCDHELLLKSLNERFTTPEPSLELKSC